MKADNGWCRSPDNYSFMTVHWHASGKRNLDAESNNHGDMTRNGSHSRMFPVVSYLGLIAVGEIGSKRHAWV